MATEVGTAYATILPSAKGFARNLQKSIAREFAGADLNKMVADALAGRPLTVPVRPDFTPGDVPDEVPVRPGQEPTLPVQVDPLTEALRDDLRKQLAAITKEITASVEVTSDTDGLRTELSESIRQIEASLSADIPTEPGDRREYERKLREQVTAVSQRVRAHIEADVDVDANQPGLRNEIDVAGNTIGRNLATSIIGSVTSALGAVAGPALFGGLIAAAAVTAPLIGATIAAGILGAVGGGVIGLAILSLAKNPLLQRAASGLGGAIQQTFAKAAAPLLGTEDKPGPLLLAIETLTDLVVELGPSLEQMFASIGPYIPTLAAGLAEFVRAVMPGLLDAVEASGPVIEAIAFNLGPLGEALGSLLSTMAILAPAAIDALSVLFSLINHLLRTVAGLVYVLGAAFGGIYGWYEDLRDKSADVWSFVTYLFANAGRVIPEILRGIVAAAGRLWRDLTGRLRSVTSGGIANVVSLFSGLRGRIVGALGNTRDLLVNAGRNIIQGLINGVRSMIGHLQGLLNSVTRMIPSWKGPLDTDRRLLQPAGAAIMGGLIRGIRDEVPALRSQLGAVTDLIAGTPLAAPTVPYGLSAATPTPAGMRVEWVGGDGDPLVRAFRENIRIYYGGSPQAALAS